MHCSACVSKIKQALSSQDGVVTVDADLLSKSATITGDIKPDLLMKAVKDAGYESSIIDNHLGKPKKSKKEPTSQLQQLFPLFLIFFYITVFSLIINRSDFQLDDFMYDFMGLFYICSVFSNFWITRIFQQPFPCMTP